MKFHFGRFALGWFFLALAIAGCTNSRNANLSGTSSLTLNVQGIAGRAFTDHGFDCIGVNVVGAGISSSVETLNGFSPVSTDSILAGSVCTYMGALSDTVPVAAAGGEVSLTVPPGKRVVQLLGYVLESDGSCPNAATLKTYLGSNDPTDTLAGVFEIGRATVDLKAGDNVVNITASYDSSEPKDVRCDSARKYSAYCSPSGMHTASNYPGGSGAAGDPWTICTAEQFATLTDDTPKWDEPFALKNNLELGTLSPFVPIGSSPPFTGDFNGGGHYIKYSADATAESQGLFGIVEGGKIYDLRVRDSNLTSSFQNAGLLVGFLKTGSEITNVSIESTDFSSAATRSNITGAFRTGGLIGLVFGGTVTNVVSHAAVRCTTGECGGLFGYLGGGTVTRSKSSGTVAGFETLPTNNSLPRPTPSPVPNVGGFVGRASRNGADVTISRSGSIATVNANVSLSESRNYGGFAGLLQNVTVRECYALGDVTVLGAGVGGDYVGGFAGTITNSTTTIIEDSYSAGSVEGPASAVGGFVGSTGGTYFNAVYSSAPSVKRSVGSGFVGHFTGLATSPGTGCVNSETDSLCVAASTAESPAGGPAESPPNLIYPARNALLGPSTVFDSDAFSTSKWEFPDGEFPKLKNAKY